MARIRTIKPEFPQSESMGRVSRDARLCFIQMWTLADDEGRLRGNSRMLASLLFPYDDDAKDLIDGWIEELENEGCVQPYKLEGDSYIQISNWLIHQKIDKPSRSKIPTFEEYSRKFSKPLEDSSEDQGSRIKDQGSISNSDELLDDSIAADGKPNCPHQQIIALYHEVLPMCPGVRDWTPARATQLRARWNEDEKRQNLDYWKSFFGYVAECDFLVGKGSGKPFFADLEWLVKQANFTKVREGKYENRRNA